MFLRVWGWVFYPSVMREADRLLRCSGPAAIGMVRRSVVAAGERSRSGYWTCVLHELERRMPYRPW